MMINQNNLRSAELVTAAATYPITMAELKTHLRITYTTSAEEDAYIEGLVKVGTQLCEDYCNMYFINTTVKTYFDYWPIYPALWLTLFKSPVGSVSSVKYFDGDGAEQTWAASEYQADLIARPAKVKNKWDKTYPVLNEQLNAVVVEYVVGFGAAASDVPEAIKQAIKMAAATFYENRQDQLVGVYAQKLPIASRRLLDIYRIDLV